MKRTIIESPFRGNERYTEDEHRAYLERCTRDSVQRGESPYASHKMLTDALDDSDPDERKLGIDAGMAWKHLPDVATVFYLDYGWSDGMKFALEYMHEHGGMEYELRRIGKNPENNG